MTKKALAKRKPRGELQPTKNLDAAVTSITIDVAQATHSYWRVGQTLARIVEGGFWKERRDENGLPKYRNFKEFAPAELGMSSVHCYRFINIARTISEEDAAKLTMNQARQVVHASNHPSLPEKAKPVFLAIQLSKDEKAKLQARAVSAGVPLNRYVRAVLLVERPPVWV